MRNVASRYWYSVFGGGRHDRDYSSPSQIGARSIFWQRGCRVRLGRSHFFDYTPTTAARLHRLRLLHSNRHGCLYNRVGAIAFLAVGIAHHPCVPAVRLQRFTLNDFALRSIFSRNEPPNPAKYLSERREMIFPQREVTEGHNKQNQIKQRDKR